jgi:hypothetical protein
MIKAVLQRWNRQYSTVLGNQNEYEEIVLMSSEGTDDEQPQSLEEFEYEFEVLKNNKVPGTDGL